jgi:hypothetical protein
MHLPDIMAVRKKAHVPPIMSGGKEFFGKQLQPHHGNSSIEIAPILNHQTQPLPAKRNFNNST